MIVRFKARIIFYAFRTLSYGIHRLLFHYSVFKSLRFHITPFSGDLESFPLLRFCPGGLARKWGVFPLLRFRSLSFPLFPLVLKPRMLYRFGDAFSGTARKMNKQGPIQNLWNLGPLRILSLIATLSGVILTSLETGEYYSSHALNEGPVVLDIAKTKRNILCRVFVAISN